VEGKRGARLVNVVKKKQSDKKLRVKREEKRSRGGKAGKRNERGRNRM